MAAGGRNILVAISIHNKLDFINGTSTKPLLRSPLARQWQRCNDLVVSWWVNSSSKKISHSVEYSTYAKDIWCELEERYTSYKVRVCNCGGKAAEDEEQKVYQFLMDLNDTYMQTRNNILIKKPLPSVGNMYNILLYDEKHRQVSSVPILHSDDLITIIPNLYFPTFSTLLAFANFAGKLMPYEGVSYGACMLSSMNGIVWIIDFGATDQMTSIRSLLLDIITLLIPYLLSLPNGYKVKVTNVGSLALFSDLILHNVLYIPSFKHNLISVHKLLSHCDDVVQFTKSACTFQGPSVRKPVVLGRLNNGLYKLFQHVTSPVESVNVNSYSSIACSLHVVSNNVAIDNSSVNTMVDSNKMNKSDVVWHYTLGHIPFFKMKLIFGLDCRLSSKQSFICPIFPLARQAGLPFPDSSIQFTHPFQFVHIDTWGPYSTPTHSGSKYFLTTIDDYTRATWTHLMGAKSNAFDLLKPFIFMVETQFQTKVQTDYVCPILPPSASLLAPSSSESVSFNATIIQLHNPEPYTYSHAAAIPEW
ncbi:uncharacterized protein [Nicotiana sylvestris]|uniref:uncharacterized protein n=1 Tax=Nicotiana sylvestris TaxID=4096 RepID=UPI00388C6711